MGVEKEHTQSKDAAGNPMAVDVVTSALAEQCDSLKFVKELAMYYMDFLQKEASASEMLKTSWWA
jgi:hypothetical protein